MFYTSRFAGVAVTSLALALVAMQAAASDRSMRCGTHLIYAGGGKDSTIMYEVLKKCGEPDAKNGNNWLYVQGNSSRFLTFKYDGRLQRIETRRN